MEKLKGKSQISKKFSDGFGRLFEFEEGNKFDKYGKATIIIFTLISR